MILLLLAVLALSSGAFLVSRAPTLAYFLYFLAFVPFVSFDPEPGGLQSVADLDGQNVLYKMSIRLATSAGLVLLLFRHRSALRHAFLPSCWPVVVFVIWAAAGLTRLESPWIPMFRLGELLIFFLTGVCLYLEAGRHHPPRAVARWHCLALLPLCLATLYLAWTRPEVAYHEGLAGIRLGHRFIEPNVLGFAACVVMLWATHELREAREGAHHWTLERMLPLLALAVSALVLVLARSRTAMITAIAGQFLLWFPFYRGDARRRALFAIFVLGTLSTAAAFSDVIASWFLRGDPLADLMSATGRTELWRALLTEQVPRAPFFGTGYLTLGGAGHFEHAGVWWTNAHNTYLFALVSTGLPGLIAVLAIAFAPLRATFGRIFRSSSADRPAWVLLFALQTVVAMTSITGFGITGFPNAAMLFSYAIYMYCVAPVGETVAVRPGEEGRPRLPRASVGPQGPFLGNLVGARHAVHR